MQKPDGQVKGRLILCLLHKRKHACHPAVWHYGPWKGVLSLQKHQRVYLVSFQRLKEQTRDFFWATLFSEVERPFQQPHVQKKKKVPLKSGAEGTVEKRRKRIHSKDGGPFVPGSHLPAPCQYFINAVNPLKQSRRQGVLQLGPTTTKTFHFAYLPVTPGPRDVKLPAIANLQRAPSLQ